MHLKSVSKGVKVSVMGWVEFIASIKIETEVETEQDLVFLIERNSERCILPFCLKEFSGGGNH